jgi:hypothetical protein
MPESIFPPGFVEAFSIEENTPENWLGALALLNYETLTVEIPPLDLGFFYDPRDEMLEWEASETENVQPPDNEGQTNSGEHDPLNTAFDSGSDIED